MFEDPVKVDLFFLLGFLVIGIVVSDPGTVNPGTCIESIPSSKILSNFYLACPGNQVITSIAFATYGAPVGTCEDDNLKSSPCAVFPSDKWSQEQFKVDQNVYWTIDNLCYGKPICTFRSIYNDTPDPDFLFGDPCPHRDKFLAVKVMCGPTPPKTPKPRQIAWSSNQKFNSQNFKITNLFTDIIYDVVDGLQPFDYIQKSLIEDAQINIDPNPNLDVPRFGSLLAKESILGVRIFGVTSALYGVLAETAIADQYILAFRGSLTATDYAYDIEISSSSLNQELCQKLSPEICQEIEVHTGFQRLYMSLRPKLIQYIELYRPKTLMITGHSLGAALATLAAFDLANYGQRIHSIYTWASPRVGNPVFVSTFEKLVSKASGLPRAPVYRIANSADIVTMVPHPSLSKVGGFIPKYMHVGDSKYTFEYIPAGNRTILKMEGSDFIRWAHSLTTYSQIALDFIDPNKSGYLRSETA